MKIIEKWLVSWPGKNHIFDVDRSARNANGFVISNDMDDKYNGSNWLHARAEFNRQSADIRRISIRSERE